MYRLTMSYLGTEDRTPSSHVKTPIDLPRLKHTPSTEADQARPCVLESTT